MTPPTSQIDTPIKSVSKITTLPVITGERTTMKIIYLTDSYKDNNELCKAAQSITESLHKNLKHNQDIKDRINVLHAFKNSSISINSAIIEAIDRETGRLESMMYKEYRKEAEKLALGVKKELMYLIPMH